jgi:hypothetical protein
LDGKSTTHPDSLGYCGNQHQELGLSASCLMNGALDVPPGKSLAFLSFH